jgi:hypothetical protein
MARNRSGFPTTQGVLPMMVRPSDMGQFEFVRIIALRATQLIRGCTPRVPASSKVTTTARREVASGKVCGLPRVDAVAASKA